MKNTNIDNIENNEPKDSMFNIKENATQIKAYTILSKLGMIDEDEDYEVFYNACKNLPSLMNYIDYLCAENDLDMIKRFLLCFLYNED